MYTHRTYYIIIHIYIQYNYAHYSYTYVCSKSYSWRGASNNPIRSRTAMHACHFATKRQRVQSTAMEHTAIVLLSKLIRSLGCHSRSAFKRH